MRGTAVTAPRGRASPAARLLAVNFAVCLLLLIQYLLGMVVNLYVTIPGHHPGVGAQNYFAGLASGLAWVIPDGPAWAAAHAAFGLALALVASACVALTWGKSSRMATVTSVLGALAILGAGFNGMSFLNYGHDFSSMIMAGLWGLALACYVTGLLLAIQLRIDR
jgi:FtsH-binding integral membrane protein